MDNRPIQNPSAIPNPGAIPKQTVQATNSPNAGQHAAAKNLTQSAQTPLEQSLEKVDNISRVKLLMGQLRKSLSVVLKTASLTLRQNCLTVTTKTVVLPANHFNKTLEEFYSICDLMEIYLNAAIECYDQNSDSARYTPLRIRPYKTENIIGIHEGISYPEYLKLVETQIKYIQDVYQLFEKAAQGIVY